MPVTFQQYLKNIKKLKRESKKIQKYSKPQTLSLGGPCLQWEI
jgi:hypothetical protein